MADTLVYPKFCPIPNFPKYKISRDGVILSKRFNRPMRQTLDTGGYPGVFLCHNGTRQRFCTHYLVLTTFVGPKPDGMECRHLDGNRANSHLDNLCWGTKLDNMADRKRHGRDPHRLGESHPMAKLTNKDVRSIRCEYGSGKTSYSRLAKKYGVSLAMVCLIVQRKNWSHIV